MLLQSATKQQVEAVRRLHLSEMKPLLELLESDLEKSRAQLVRADETPKIYRLQGRVQILEDLLQSVAKAGDIFTNG